MEGLTDNMVFFGRSKKDIIRRKLTTDKCTQKMGLNGTPSFYRESRENYKATVYNLAQLYARDEYCIMNII